LQTFPFFGIVAEILSEDGSIVEGEGEGYLVNNRLLKMYLEYK